MFFRIPFLFFEVFQFLFSKFFFFFCLVSISFFRNRLFWFFNFRLIRRLDYLFYFLLFLFSLFHYKVNTRTNSWMFSMIWYNIIIITTNLRSCLNIRCIWSSLQCILHSCVLAKRYFSMNSFKMNLLRFHSFKCFQFNLQFLFLKILNFRNLVIFHEYTLFFFT